MKISRLDNSDKYFESLFARMPESLYKYVSLSEPESFKRLNTLLLESKLYFAPSSAFNDPLDCRIPLQFDGTSLAIGQFWRRHIERAYRGKMTRDDKKKRILELIQKSKSKAGQKELSSFAYKELDKHGIVCLSQHPDSMLMWSYYAAGHSGLALRFKINPAHLSAIGERVVPIEVRYCADFPKINYYDSELQELISAVFGSKSEAWSHEREWRLVARDRIGLVRIPPSMIDGIVMGLQIRPDSEAAIRDLIRKRPFPMDLLRVQHRENSFELELIPSDL